MARIANSKVPYHGLKMNCSTTTLMIVNAGISQQLKLKLKENGYSVPQSNLFFETPQSVLNFSLQLSNVLIKVRYGVKEKQGSLFGEFTAKVHNYFIKLLSQFFKINAKDPLRHLKKEYEHDLKCAMEGLAQLTTELKSGKISLQIHQELQNNGKKLIQDYTKKIEELDFKLSQDSINKSSKEAHGGQGFFGKAVEHKNDGDLPAPDQPIANV